MSRQNMAVHFADGTVRHGLYNSTADVIWPALFDTAEEAWEVYDEDWDRFSAVFYPEPVGDPEPVVIVIDDTSPKYAGSATRNAVVSPCTDDAMFDARLHSAREWVKLDGIMLADPDGWRGPEGRPLEDEITFEEYKRRRASSSIIGAPRYW